MVVHRKTYRFIRSSHLHRFTVGYIINDENPQPPDSIENLSLLFPVCKLGILYLDGKIGTLERCWTFGPGNTLIVQVIHKRNCSQNLFLTHSVAFGQGCGEFFVALQIETAKVLHNLAGEIF